METFDSIDAILDFAIEREQEAVDFYLDWMGKAENPALKKVLKGFASVEEGHKIRLAAVKTRKIELAPEKEVIDLKIADYLVAVEPASDLSFQDALLIAIKREQAAMQLYTDLVQIISGEDVQQLFRALAQEESHHKRRFEVEYEEHFLSEN